MYAVKSLCCHAVTLLFLAQALQPARPIHNAEKIEGRLLDENCGSTGGFPIKVIHVPSCLVRYGPTKMYILEDGTGHFVPLTGIPFTEAAKLRPELLKGELWVVLTGGHLKKL